MMSDGDVFVWELELNMSAAGEPARELLLLFMLLLLFTIVTGEPGRESLLKKDLVPKSGSSVSSTLYAPRWSTLSRCPGVHWTGDERPVWLVTGLNESREDERLGSYRHPGCRGSLYAHGGGRGVSIKAFAVYVCGSGKRFLTGEPNFGPNLVPHPPREAGRYFSAGGTS